MEDQEQSLSNILGNNSEIVEQVIEPVVVKKKRPCSQKQLLALQKNREKRAQLDQEKNNALVELNRLKNQSVDETEIPKVVKRKPKKKIIVESETDNSDSETVVLVKQKVKKKVQIEQEPIEIEQEQDYYVDVYDTSRPYQYKFW
ncbi:MAG: hypothetical protein AABY22_13385 [Nanoarchaeota archaeon]